MRIGKADLINEINLAHMNLTGEPTVVSPVEGNIWYDGTAFNFRDASSTIDLLAGGAIEVDVVTFTRDVALASGTQAIVGVGFQPRAVIALASITGTAVACWGFSVGSGGNNGAVIFSDSLSPGFYQITGPEFIKIEQTIATGTYEGQIQSFDSDGFTIVWVRGAGAPTGTLRVHVYSIR